MKKKIIGSFAFLALFSGVFWFSVLEKPQSYAEFLKSHPYHIDNSRVPEPRKIPKRDRPDLAWQQDYLRTMDPALKRPAPERLEATRTQVKEYFTLMSQSRTGTSQFPWVERGPTNVGGRTRGLMWDPNDNTGKKVWAGGVTGGLWFTNDIYNTNVEWQKIDDFWENIAVTSIAADPNAPEIFYVGTGEGFGTGSSRGGGVWKSTNGGASWTKLNATTDFYYVNDLAVRNENGTSVLYVGVRANFYQGDWFGLNMQGLQRSTDGGTTFTQVMPNVPDQSIPFAISDIEIAGDNKLWVGTTNNAFSADNRGGGSILHSTNGTSWTLATQRADASRVEIACAPSNADVVYALIESGGAVSEVLKTTDGGTSWTNLDQPVDDDEGISADDFSRGQAWYDLILAVDPNNPDVVLAGAIDLFKSTNGGSSWAQIAHWYGGYGHPYVHADQHAIVYKPGSSTDVIFGHDGGIDLSTNITQSAPSFTNRNNHYNVTQFYAAAIHPSVGSNYFLAGSQDNGTQQFTLAGLGSTEEATGGDGGFCFIDQLNPSIQITAYVYNQYWISTNGGASFPNNFSISDENSGQFINPCDYDDNQGILYTVTNDASIGRFRNIKTGNPERADFNVSMDDYPSHLRVSPYTTSSTTLFVGTEAGSLYKITNANEAHNVSNISGSNFPDGSISCVEIGENEDHLLVTFSNYGVNSVWISTNGGATWTSKEGNLPDMPVRWALFNPNDYNEVILATELGVWRTENITAENPNWVSSNVGLANVRVDMLQIRASDNEVIAATYGRGLYSSSGFSGSTSTGLSANFSASASQVFKDDNVSFTDQSTGNPVSWLWTFEGGEPATSTSQNPMVNYATEGTFDVTLKVTDDTGKEDTKTITNMIQVNPPPLPNLVGITPDDWTGSITVYSDPEAYETQVDLSVLMDPVMMAYGIINSGDKEIAISFSANITLDGEDLAENVWDFSINEPMDKGAVWVNFNIDIGSLDEGEHTLTVTLDPDNEIEEKDETDNTFDLTFYVQNSCVGVATLTALQGTITDGSGSANYLNDLNCEWIIAPERAASITLSFQSFALEDDFDFLLIFDSKTATTPIASLTGSTIPQAITIESGEVVLKFETDESFQQSGWTLNYTTELLPLGLSNQPKLKLYPNPVSEFLTFDTGQSEVLSYQVTDIGGRQMSFGEVQSSKTLDICGYAPGVYLLSVQIDQKWNTTRFVVQH